MRAMNVFDKPLRVTASLALAASMVVVAPGAAQAAGDEDGKVLTISTETALRQLAADVNAGTSYAGWTVKLTGNVDLDGAFTPIGTPEHPFCGTFSGYETDGSAERMRTISGLEVEGDDYLGLFGYVGAGGLISNITLEDATITAASDANIVKCVGALAGYSYGSISNCVTDGGTVTATSTMELTEDDDHRKQYTPEEPGEPGVSNLGSVVEYVGGIAGYCAGSVTGCSNAAKVHVEARQAPDSNYLGLLAMSVGGVAGQVGGYVTVEQVADKDGKRFAPSYPTGDGTYSLTTDEPSLVSHCVNTAVVETLVDGESGVDRFGVTSSAVVESVGGIVGYSMANVSDCLNKVAYSYKTVVNETGESVTWPTSGILAETGDGVGGIVGCLRGVAFTGTSPALSDGGSYKGTPGPVLTVSNCVNDAGVIGRHAAAGVVGDGGTYTVVTLSANVNANANIVGVRWNKPTSGGIAGQTYGDVTYCYNRSTLESYTHAGFYMGGVVGMTCVYEASNGSDFDSPVPEVTGCFFSGYLIGGADYKHASIVGENSGMIANCYSTCPNDVYAENYGTVAETTKTGVKVTELQSKDYVAKLNASVSYEQYAQGSYFQASAVSDTKAPEAYPVLHSAVFTDENSVVYGAQGEGVFPTSIQALDAGKASFEGVGKARYAAQGNPLPQLSVAYDGAPLVQGADYYPVPDANALDANGVCRDVSDLASVSLTADMAGMGTYTGTVALGAPYQMDKGDFSTCTVSIKAHEFNYLPQWPATPTDADDSEVVIRDASGTRISAEDFTMEEDPGDCIKRKVTTYNNRTYEGYKVEFTATESANYEGTLVGFFVITKGTLFSTNCEFEGLTWNGQTWYWHKSTRLGIHDDYFYQKDEKGNPVTDENGEVIKGIQVTYTGEPIKLAIIEGGFTFKDGNGTYRPLVEGEDYRIVYGDPGDASNLITSDTENPNTNVTTDVVGERACITIRYNRDTNACNFTNYYNFFFDILPADLSTCAVSVTATNAAQPSVKLTNAAGKALVEGTDFTYVVTPNADGGSTVVITGTGNYTGTVSKKVVTSGSSTPKVTVGKVAKITKATVGKKRVTLTWKKVSGAKGYRIAYRVKGKKAWKYTTAKTAKKVVKKLKKGKKYQFKVQAYKVVNGSKRYGSYCAVKTSKKVK